MIDKLFALAEGARDLTFGWRKLGLLVVILATLFIWLFVNTLKTETAVIVADLPMNFAALIGVLYLTFVAGNWAGKVEKRKGSGEPS